MRALQLQPLPDLPDHPDEFPAPPIGYEMLFTHWAGAWRQRYGTQPINADIHDALQHFVAGITVPNVVALDMAESALASAYHQLSMAQSLASSSQHELFLATNSTTREDMAIGSAIVAYDLPRIEAAKTHAQWASDSLRHTQALYDQAKDIFAREQDSYTTKMMAYYQQRDLVYSALGVESLVTTTGHLVAGWELVLKPLARVAITGGAALPPLEETPECACLVISCDPGSLVAARRFQRDMLRRHPRIQGLQVEAKQVEAAIYDVNSRDLPLRATAMDHFMTEMEPRIRAILLISKPHVQFQVTSGVTGNCTELFLVVEALNQVGRQVRCSVAVLFTAPYHSDDGCNDTLTNEASPSWVVDSELPSGKYGRKILGRIREYFEGGSALAPPAVCGTIHKHIAIWSTYNDMWIVRREGTRNPTCTQPETLPRAEAESMLTISTRFAATNADPHIAFVYVEVLDDIIETMQESTEGYPLESQELLSTNPTTAM